MTNKEKLKKSISSDFSKENNYNEIIKKFDKEDTKIKNNVWKWSLAPICLVAIIVGILFKNSKNNNIVLDNYTDKENNIILNINNIDTNYSDILRDILFDADIKEISTNGLFIPWPEMLIGITIPKDLDKFHATAVYTRNNKTNECDILNSYVYNYSNELEEDYKSIRIAFSDTNKPLRDYFFSEENSKETIINNVKITIFQYNDIYFTEFSYKDYHFDIEANNISEQELSNLLVSIIK